MAAISPAEMLTTYALTLMIMGALAYQAAPPGAKAMSSIYMGNGGAVISFLLAVGARDVTLKKGDSGYIPMMICIHLAFIFPILFGAAVTWRLSVAWSVSTKTYLRPYFIIIIAASVLTAVVVYAAKPNISEDHNEHSPEKQQPEEIDKARCATEIPVNETVRRRRRAAAL